MRAKSLALLMLALGCGLVASIGVTQLMAKKNTESAPAGETQSIFIAVKDISVGEPLSAECLKLEAWPKDKVPPGSVSKIEDIEGCRTRTKLYAGEPILEKKLFGKGVSMQGSSTLIPVGYRVVPVKVDNVSGGPGLIMPGDRVDVLVHLVRDPQHDVHETATRTILEDIKVFAVDDVVDLEREKDGKDSKDKISAKTISLLVTPAQAARLTLAAEMGKVRLVMRSSEDKGNSADGTSTPGELFGGAKKSDRDRETLYKPDEPATKPKSTGLSDFLRNMKKQLDSKPKTDVSTAPNVPNESWKMQILGPSGINQVILESDNEPHAAKMPNGGWHINSTSTISIGGGSGGTSMKIPAPPPKGVPTDKAPAGPSEPTVTSPDGPDLEPSGEPKANPAPQENPPTDKASPADPTNSSADGNPFKG